LDHGSIAGARRVCPKLPEDGRELRRQRDWRGAAGFWGRWSQYIDNGHGGNKKLMNRKRSDYRVSILHVASSAETDDDVRAIEQEWKDNLHTRANGLNDN
jgi:hypothetical protein